MASCGGNRPSPKEQTLSGAIVLQTLSNSRMEAIQNLVLTQRLLATCTHTYQEGMCVFIAHIMRPSGENGASPGEKS